jgi:hypothetical protein
MRALCRPGGADACRQHHDGNLRSVDKSADGPHSMKRPVSSIKSGAPGWNRTSDTRFGKHATGVTGYIARCARVLHSPRFCRYALMLGSKAWRAVLCRLVGSLAAMQEGAGPSAPAPSPEALGLLQRELGIDEAAGSEVDPNPPSARGEALGREVEHIGSGRGLAEDVASVGLVGGNGLELRAPDAAR